MSNRVWSKTVIALLSGLVGALCKLGEVEAATGCVHACATVVPNEVKKELWDHILKHVEVDGEPN